VTILDGDKYNEQTVNVFLFDILAAMASKGVSRVISLNKKSERMHKALPRFVCRFKHVYPGNDAFFSGNKRVSCKQTAIGLCFKRR
jgi:hypothetical protein